MIKSGYYLQLNIADAYGQMNTQNIDGLEHLECQFLIDFAKLFTSRMKGGFGYRYITNADILEAYTKLLADFEKKEGVAAPAEYTFAGEDQIYDMVHDIIGTCEDDHYQALVGYNVYFIESDLSEVREDFN